MSSEPKPDPQTILAGLAKRAEEIREEQILNLRVPRWDNPVIVVKCRPMTNAQLLKGLDRVGAAKRADMSEVALNVNADMLISCCVAVVAVIDGAEYSLRPGEPDGDPTTFDPDLAAALGMPDGSTARQVVRTLFITDPDLTSAVRAVAEWSGAREQEAGDLLAGE